MPSTLEYALLGCAVFQGITATANLALTRILRWKPELERLPLLLQQVFQVHSWFISATVAIFAVLTARFSREMAAGDDEALRWLAGAIALFWTLRVGLQLGYYSPAHWRGNRGRTAVHFAALLGFGGLATCYGWAALR